MQGQKSLSDIQIGCVGMGTPKLSHTHPFKSIKTFAPLAYNSLLVVLVCDCVCDVCDVCDVDPGS